MHFYKKTRAAAMADHHPIDDSTHGWPPPEVDDWSLWAVVQQCVLIPSRPRANTDSPAAVREMTAAPTNEAEVNVDSFSGSSRESASLNVDHSSTVMSIRRRNNPWSDMEHRLCNLGNPVFCMVMCQNPS